VALYINIRVPPFSLQTFGKRSRSPQIHSISKPLVSFRKVAKNPLIDASNIILLPFLLEISSVLLIHDPQVWLRLNFD